MKTYEAEVEFIKVITVTLEAESKDDAYNKVRDMDLEQEFAGKDGAYEYFEITEKIGGEIDEEI